MMSQPDEVARAHKLASIVCRRGALVPICCRVPCGWWAVGARPGTKALAELLVLDLAPPTIKSGGTHRTGDTSSLWCLTRRQSPTVRGAVGWLARRVWPATLPSARCQGHCRLVGLSRSLCQATNRLLVGVPQVGQPIASAPPCHWPPVVLSTVYCQARYGPGRDSDSPNWTYRGHVGT
ncbi:hypothetical protein B296_00013468 [Ensete ventricosum]|uniref:Uncharacterized protein n=1 Tax=Ensete ventricosum TaxID=4639 RepID=A0A426ZPZ4_ENSVE|nr:hypothetical protein B296_00013468 [Ensete ventricosum]